MEEVGGLSLSPGPCTGPPGLAGDLLCRGPCFLRALWRQRVCSGALRAREGPSTSPKLHPRPGPQLHPAPPLMCRALPPRDLGHGLHSAQVDFRFTV